MERKRREKIKEERRREKAEERHAEGSCMGREGREKMMRRRRGRNERKRVKEKMVEI